MNGRIEGGKTDDGQAYEIRLGDTLLLSIPIEEAAGNTKLLGSIERNGWEKI